MTNLHPLTDRPDTTDLECTVCGATVASWPEVMCCHCRTVPWRRLSTSAQPSTEAVKLADERWNRLVEFLEYERDTHQRSENEAEAEEISELLEDVAALRQPSLLPSGEEVRRQALEEVLQRIAMGEVPGDPDNAHSLFMNARKMALDALNTTKDHSDG